MTIRESILLAAAALCDALPSVTAFRSREAALARSEGDAIIVRPDDEDVQLLGVGAAQRDLVLLFEVIARGTIPDQAADPTIDALHTSLMADPTLGGRIAQLSELSTKWNFEIADQNAVAVEIRYRARYLTRAGSLNTAV